VTVSRLKPPYGPPGDAEPRCAGAAAGSGVWARLERHGSRYGCQQRWRTEAVKVTSVEDQRITPEPTMLPSTAARTTEFVPDDGIAVADRDGEPDVRDGALTASTHQGTRPRRR